MEKSIIFIFAICWNILKIYKLALHNHSFCPGFTLVTFALDWSKAGQTFALALQRQEGKGKAG
jgi:hypothetical protein